MHPAERLILALYAATDDPDALSSFVELFGEVFEATSGATIILTDLATRTGSMLASTRVDRIFSQAYQAYYGQKNIFVNKAAARQQRLLIATGEDLCPIGEMLASEYYNDFLRPQRAHHSLGIAVSEESFHAHLGATRPAGADPFNSQDLEIASAIAPHFAQTMLLREKFLRLKRRGEALQDLAERLPFGVLWLDRAGRVVEASGFAARTLAAADGLSVSKGRLHAALSAENLRLHATIADAIGHDSRGAGGSLRISRPSGARSYALTVFPLPPSADYAAMIMIADPQREAAPMPRRLSQLFALTPTEASLCLALLDGATLQQSADQLGIAISTARTHFKRILSKTQTSRQSELMRLLMASLPLSDPTNEPPGSAL